MSHALTGVTVMIVLLVARKLIPYKASTIECQKSLEELKREYTKWELFAILPFFVCVAALMYFWYGLFRDMADWFAHGLPPCHYLFMPCWAFWALPALFLGIITSALPVILLYKALLRERYAEYIHYTNLKAGFDGLKVFAWISAPIVVLAVAAVVIGINTYTQFKDDAIVIKRPVAWRPVAYPYGRVAAVAEVARLVAPNGNLVDRTHYVIRFDDGTSWTSEDGMHEGEPEHDRAAVTFAAEAAGKAILNLDTIDDLNRGGFPK